jgi:hypothetical protein
MLNLSKIKKNQKEFTRKKRSRKENQENKILQNLKEIKKKGPGKNKKGAFLSTENSSLENSSNNYKIENCKSVIASEKDFSQILKYIESLWNKEDNSTGIIKITPPSNWRKVNDYIFDNYYFTNFMKSEKKLETRIQNLAGLCEGRVSNNIFKRIVLFFIILLWFSCTSSYDRNLNLLKSIISENMSRKHQNLNRKFFQGNILKTK